MLALSGPRDVVLAQAGDDQTAPGGEKAGTVADPALGARAYMEVAFAVAAAPARDALGSATVDSLDAVVDSPSLRPFLACQAQGHCGPYGVIGFHGLF